MYRIGRQQFSTRDEAEDWAHGNIGGTYSIVPLAFCHTCGDWEDDDWSDNPRCSVCGATKADDGEFYHGNKALARLGIRYYEMQGTHPMWDLRCWVFGFPVRG
jgi:hypothetical protein